MRENGKKRGRERERSQINKNTNGEIERKDKCRDRE